MWQNILAIVVIILLSAFFRQKTNQSFNSQMLFILLALVSLVFYKLMYLNNMKNNKDILILQNKEGFEGNLGNHKINSFVNNTEKEQPQNLNQNQNQKTTELHNRLDSMESMIKDINNNQVKPRDKNNGINTDYMVREQIDNIKKMDNDIKDIIKMNANSISDDKYPSIKLYSSCVSNADGTITNNDNNNNNNNNNDEQKNDINIISPDINIHLAPPNN